MAAKKLISDPELEELVRELNRGGEEEEPVATPSWPAAELPSENPLEILLVEMAQRGASDLLLLQGAPPILRVGGRLARTDRPALDADDLQSILGSFITGRVREKIDADGSADFSL